MSKRETVKDIVDSMLDFFEVESFSDLDKSMLEELVGEIEDCLGIEVDKSLIEDEVSRKHFIDSVMAVYEET